MRNQFRRGFKSEAESHARELRKELGLKPYDPLCPWALAECLDIPVEALSNYKGEIPEAVCYFLEKDIESFSAVTLFDGYRRSIIHNDSHHRRRQAANIAHELSHGILGHRPTPVLDELGCRYFNDGDEDEANWLGPTLLISKEAAIHIAKTQMSMNEAVRLYGVSEQIITMRLNVTGARKIVERSQAKSFRV